MLLDVVLIKYMLVLLLDVNWVLGQRCVHDRLICFLSFACVGTERGWQNDCSQADARYERVQTRQSLSSRYKVKRANLEVVWSNNGAGQTTALRLMQGTKVYKHGKA